ncbi:MAG: response regulator, partial [Burkholderiales bacterium]|nr:response regulator [Burkholderiales bacterium]
EVCQRMRERADWRHIKIIMLSAKGREAEVNKGLSMGADFYVTKPFSNKELVAKIGELLGSAAQPGGT